jgi:hypothetical protein
MLNEVTAALAAIEAGGTFATELACGSDDLHLEVKGVGPIRFPILPATARKLCAVARPAPFGRRGETLHDASVRDTLEIAASQIKIHARSWRRTLEPQLAILRRHLGVPDRGKLTATLDKMLVYGPGQFFASHQDSERADDMVGSLVVELPSRHEGGGFVVEHRGEKKVFRGAARGVLDLSLLAFYADCHHEVKPVDSGYRITLTYHLIFHGEPGDRAPLPLSAVKRLAASVKAYFTTPIAPTYSRSAPEQPDRLIYLLDHEYTQKSLRWGHLKDADQRRTDALREVAGRLDCEVFLALADVHENWSCEEDDWGGRYGRRGWYRHDDELKKDRGAAEYELIELVTTDVELRHWVGPDGLVVPGISSKPASNEVCSTRASAEMDPFKSEHEGNMGNYGNTVDRWYHRAALVIWPRERDFVVRAKISPSWAMKHLTARITAGAMIEARLRANQLLPFWNRTASQETGEAFVLQLLTVAASLNDADLAFGLLSPLGPHQLGQRAAPVFAALVGRHGVLWAQRVFAAWAEGFRHDTTPWLPVLPRLSEVLTAAGEQGKALALWLLSREVATLKKRHAVELELRDILGEEGANRHLDDLLALLETAAVIGAPDLRDDLVAFLVAPATALPLMAAGALLQKCREARTPAAVRAFGLQTLYRHVVDSLEEVLAKKVRSPDDWSFEPPSGCKCELCKELSAFLRDRAKIQYPWPLAKERRRHIHGILDRHGLPVTHTTVRRGSPQTLVLTKQEALFEREKALRLQQKTLLAWLEKQRRVFVDAANPC